MAEDQDHPNDSTEMYNGLGCAAVILAICLGLGSCGLMASIAGKYDAETKQIERSTKP